MHIYFVTMAKFPSMFYFSKSCAHRLHLRSSSDLNDHPCIPKAVSGSLLIKWFVIESVSGPVMNKWDIVAKQCSVKLMLNCLKQNSCLINQGAFSVSATWLARFFFSFSLFVKRRRRCPKNSDKKQQQEYIQTEEWKCVKDVTESKKTVQEDQSVHAEDETS